MKFIFVLFIFVNILNAQQKDFYYNFIDSNGEQISQQVTQKIVDGLNYIKYIRNLAQEGKTKEAFLKIEEFKNANNIKFLYSDIMILYSQLALKSQSKKLLLDTAQELETAINTSLINQQDLVKAYISLVDLKLGINKIEDAKYFSQTIIDNFDDEDIKTYGKISLSKVYKYQKEYDKATKILFDILTTTKDKQVASIVADELFDIYVLQGNMKEAKELISQIFKTNMSFYVDDVYLANKKIFTFIKFDMVDFAIELLQAIIKQSKKVDAIYDAKFSLANIYMQLYYKNDTDLDKAKALYKDIIQNNPNAKYKKAAQMYLDEILMRQNKLIPNDVANKYKDNEEMQQKALLQELINNSKDRKYEEVLKLEDIYRQIPPSILKRFGYSNIDGVLNESYIGVIQEHLSKNECDKVNQILQKMKLEIWQKLADDGNIEKGVLACIVGVPSLEVYSQIKSIFNETQDANIYLILEAMAYSLDFLDDAIGFSSKIESLNDRKVLQKEFLYKYQVMKAKNDPVLLDKFLQYASLNENFITPNEENPVIIDFYYDYYLYLLQNDITKANEILKKAYDKQKEFSAYVYSPMVEMDMFAIAKNENKTNDAINYLLEAIKHSKKINPDEEAKIYYELSSLYSDLKDSENSTTYLQKCKDLKDTSQDNLYKKMCDEK